MTMKEVQRILLKSNLIFIHVQTGGQERNSGTTPPIYLWMFIVLSYEGPKRSDLRGATGPEDLSVGL